MVLHTIRTRRSKFKKCVKSKMVDSLVIQEEDLIENPRWRIAWMIQKGDPIENSNSTSPSLRLQTENTRSFVPFESQKRETVLESK